MMHPHVVIMIDKDVKLLIRFNTNSNLAIFYWNVFEI